MRKKFALSLVLAVIDSIIAAYKIDPKYTNDLIIASFRQNALNVKNKRYTPNFYKRKNKAFIDEEYILEHLDSDQQKTTTANIHPNCPQNKVLMK